MGPSATASRFLAGRPGQAPLPLAPGLPKVLAESRVLLRPPGQAPFRMVLQSEKVLAALTLLSLLYGTYQLLKVRVPQKYLTAVMIQQNSDPWKDKSDHDSILRLIAN